MSSFDSELRQLVEEWLQKGEPLESVIEGLKYEIQRLKAEQKT